MSAWFETHRSVTFPWHCDQFGHMNVRWYAHAFDDAAFHLWNMAGVDQPALLARGIALVTARNTVDFLHELRAGDPFVVCSGMTHLGNKSLRHVHRLSNAATGTLCATMESVEVCFDMATRAAMALPAELRPLLEAKLLAPGEWRGGRD